jgi:proteasome lid subunit RPN8/RPN11
MTFWPLTSILQLFARPPELSIPAPVWSELLDGLQARGRDVRESGAFLLGPPGRLRRVTSIVFYDQIDPHAFDTGIIMIDGACMADLWAVCRRTGLAVVADVHTHPGGAAQSESDCRHPMIAEPGHIAMIIPDFAAEPVQLNAVGLYRYRGKFTWERLVPRLLRPTLKIERITL